MHIEEYITDGDTPVIIDEIQIDRFIHVRPVADALTHLSGLVHIEENR